MTEDQTLPPVMTPKTLAKAWNCSERHIRNLIDRGQLKSFKLGGKLIRIRSEDALAILPSLRGVPRKPSAAKDERNDVKRLGWTIDAPQKLPPILRPRVATTRLVAEIENWEWDYSLSTVRNPGSPSGWERQEFRHLVFRGSLVRPTRFKLRAIQLTLIPTSPEVKDMRSGDSVGHLGRSRYLWEPQVEIPASVLQPILTAADRLKFFILELDGDTRLSPDIVNFRLQMTIDEEQLKES